HQKERLMPDGCAGLIINLQEDETRLYDAEDLGKVKKLGGCTVGGPHTKCFAIDADEQTCVIGVSFRPGGVVPFLKMPSDELHNCHVNLEDLWGKMAFELRERTLEAVGPKEKLRVVELILLERAAGMFEGEPAVEYAVRNFLLQPSTSRISRVSGQ